MIINGKRFTRKKNFLECKTCTRREHASLMRSYIDSGRIHRFEVQIYHFSIIAKKCLCQLCSDMPYRAPEIQQQNTFSIMVEYRK